MKRIEEHREKEIKEVTYIQHDIEMIRIYFKESDIEKMTYWHTRVIGEIDITEEFGIIMAYTAQELREQAFDALHGIE